MTVRVSQRQCQKAFVSLTGVWNPPPSVTIVTEIITKLIRWEFSPAMFRSKITELIIGEFSSGSSLQDSVQGIRSECHWISEWKGVFGNGPGTLSN